MRAKGLLLMSVNEYTNLIQKGSDFKLGECYSTVQPVDRRYDDALGTAASCSQHFPRKGKKVMITTNQKPEH